MLRRIRSRWERLSPRARLMLSAALAVAAPLVVHVRVALGLAHFTFDYDGYHFPIASLLYEGFPALVQWDRYSYGGTALSSNFQSAAFHPPQAAVFASMKLAGFEALPEAAFAWVGLLNFMVRSLGVFVLARRISTSNAVGVIAAVLVSVSGAVLAQAQHMGVVGTFAAFPFAVWCGIACVGAVGWRRVPWGLGMSAALAYSLSAGFIPQFIAVVGTLAVVMIAVSIADRRGVIARLVTVAVATLAAFLVNAGSVAAFLLAPDMVFRINTKPPVKLEQLASVFTPDLFGLLDWPATDGNPDPTTHFAWGGFAFLPLLLAALLSRPGRRDTALAVAATTVLVLAVTPAIATVGSAGGLLEAVRSYVFVAPAFILLCVVAAGSWTRRRTLRGWRAAVLVGATLATYAALLVAELVAPFRVAPFGVVMVATAVLALALVVTLPRLPAIGSAVLCALLLAEGIVTTGRARFIESPNDQVVSTAPYNDPELLRILLSRPGLTAADSEVMGGDWNGWWSVWHVPSANGFQPTFSRYWDEASEAASTWRDDRRFAYDRLTDGAPQRLGISTYVTRSEEALEIIDRLDGAVLLYDKYGTSVITVPDADPLFSWRPDPGEIEDVDVVWSGTESVDLNVPCTSGGGVLRAVGQYDTRWTLTVSGAAQPQGVQTAGFTEWEVDGCGSARLEFADRPYLAGTAVAAIVASLLVLLAGATAWRLRRRGRGSSGAL